MYSNNLDIPELENSLRLTKDEVRDLLNSGKQYVVRLRMPKTGLIRTFDLLRGETYYDASLLDDKVIWKSSNELPTYHLANVVDDYLMKISHVIRGDEWLSSTPFHFYLYECFGWKPPVFVHSASMLDPIGKGKLSKRKEYDFPIYPLSFKDDDTEIKGFDVDFCPDGFINAIILNGWHPDETLIEQKNKEILSREQITNLFTLERLKKSGSRFDYKKCLFINKKHK